MSASSQQKPDSAPAPSFVVVFTISTAGVLMTGAVQMLLLEPSGPYFHFLAFLPAVMSAILLGGWRAGMLSFLLSCAAVLFSQFGMATHPVHTVRTELLHFTLFLGTSLAVAALADALQRARREATVARLTLHHAQTLKGNQERLQSVIDGTHAGIWEWNVQTGETVFNETWAQIIGYTLDELTPTSINTWLDCAHPDDLQRSNELLQRVFAGELVTYDCDCRMRHRDGRWIWVHDQGKVVAWTDDGRPLRMTGSHLDITDRKETEERLNALLAEQNAILAAIPLCLAKSVDGRQIWCNRTPANPMQQPIEEDLPPDTQYHFPSPGLLDDICRQADSTLRSGMIFHSEQHFATGEGEKITCRIAGKAIDPSALGKGVIWAVEDITERQRIEAELLEKERNFRTIVETISDLIVVATAEGKILFANKNLMERLGFSADELADMHILDLHPPALRTEATTIFTSMLQGEREVCPLPVMTRSGAIIPVETRVWKGFWSGRDCIYGFIRDLTADQEEKQRFEALFRHNPAIMAITSHPDRLFVDINDAFQDALGYSRSEVLGRTVDELGLFVDPGRHQKSREELLREKRITSHLHQVRHKDGSIVHGLFSGEVVHTQGRQYNITVMIDLSSRIQMENDLFQAKEKAETADAEKSRLLSVIAHEFRTPLALLNSSLDILQRYKNRLSTGDRQIQEKHIRSAISQLKSLLDVSQSYNWLQSDPRQARLTDINIQTFFREVAAEVQSVWASRHVFSLHIVTESQRVRSDEALLRSILVNLLANAFQYTPAEGAISMTVTEEGKTLCIRIEDSGIGIPASELKAVFQPFARGSNVAGKRGMGLGLNIVSIALEKLCGTIDVASDVGKGTKIELRLPVSCDARP